MQKLLDLINWWNNRDSLRTLGAVRSAGWPRVRLNHLKMNPTCSVCGGDDKCEVHHVKPFNKYPNLELDPGNLITLCSKTGRECHFIFGHLYDFKKWNPEVEEDAKKWNDKLQKA